MREEKDQAVLIAEYYNFKGEIKDARAWCRNYLLVSIISGCTLLKIVEPTSSLSWVCIFSFLPFYYFLSAFAQGIEALKVSEEVDTTRQMIENAYLNAVLTLPVAERLLTEHGREQLIGDFSTKGFRFKI